MHLIFLTLYRGTEFKLAQNKPVSPTLLIGMLKTCHDRHMLGRSNLRSNRSHITYRKTALIEALFSHIQLDGDADPRSAVTPGELSAVWLFVRTGVAFSASRSWKNIKPL